MIDWLNNSMLSTVPGPVSCRRREPVGEFRQWERDCDLPDSIRSRRRRCRLLCSVRHHIITSDISQDLYFCLSATRKRSRAVGPTLRVWRFANATVMAIHRSAQDNWTAPRHHQTASRHQRNQTSGKGLCRLYLFNCRRGRTVSTAIRSPV